MCNVGAVKLNVKVTFHLLLSPQEEIKKPKIGSSKTISTSNINLRNNDPFSNQNNTCSHILTQFWPPKWIIAWSKLGGTKDVNALAESLYCVFMAYRCHGNHITHLLWLKLMFLGNMPVPSLPSPLPSPTPVGLMSPPRNLETVSSSCLNRTKSLRGVPSTSATSTSPIVARQVYYLHVRLRVNKITWMANGLQIATTYEIPFL